MTPEPVEISRVFDAPREKVFAAWSSGERIARWFSPEGCSVPAAEVDFRAGGVFAVTMLLPGHVNSHCRGHFDEVTPPSRLAFTMEVEMQGAARFKVHTIVDFLAEGDRTRMNVRQSYELYDADYAGAPAGAREGWRSTLDKLAREIARDGAPPATHGVFTIVRDFPQSPAAVYRAFENPEAKARWFASGEGLTITEREMDVRVGGREVVKGRWNSGMASHFDATYLDVVPGTRLVYSYVLYLDERKISVSLATIEISAKGAGSQLRITEQGVFLDGYDDNGAREHGTRELVERLAQTL